jgi:hypothetical protein
MFLKRKAYFQQQKQPHYLYNQKTKNYGRCNISRKSAQ